MLRSSSFKMCLHTEGELWQINETLAVAVRSVVSQRLAHVVGLQPGFLHSLLHHLHGLHTGLRVKVAVNAHNLSSYKEETCKRYQGSNKKCHFYAITF